MKLPLKPHDQAVGLQEHQEVQQQHLRQIQLQQVVEQQLQVNRLLLHLIQIQLQQVVGQHQLRRIQQQLTQQL